VFCPEATAGPLAELIAAAARLEGSAYRHQITPLVPGQRAEVGTDLFLEAFATDHGVPSLGAHLVRRRRHLSAPYRGLSSQELVACKARGETIEEAREELWLSYCGDTGPGAFELEPRLFETRVLVIECTFLAPEHRERAARFQHLHFEDLVERAGRFRNQAIVLHHLSRRHRLAELRQAVDERLPALAPRVHLLGADGGVE
jgi:ribonuclease Z